MTEKNAAPRKARGKGKARWENRAADELTAERIRVILSDPKTPKRVRGQLEELTYNLYAETNAFSEATPDSCAADFINGVVALCVMPDENARAIYGEIVRLAEANEPEEYKVARRVAEIYAAEMSKTDGGEGRKFIMEAADAVTTEGSDGVMVSSPLYEFFPAIFVKAARDLGRDHHAYVAVKELVARVDAGEDLDALHAEDERRHAARDKRRRAAARRKPEPKDKTSFDWRLWTQRHIEDGMRSESEAERVEAWGAFWSYYDTFRDTLLGRMDYTADDVKEAAAMLPYIVGAWQREQKRGKGK